MRRRDQRGAMLIHAIVLVSLTSFAVIAVASAITARAAVVRAASASLQATYAAESGIAATVAALRNGKPASAVQRGDVGPCTWRVAVEGPPAGELTLASTGECARRQHRVVYRTSGPRWGLRRIG